MDAAQTVASTRAMEPAIGLADRLDADAVLAMHRALIEATEPAIDDLVASIRRDDLPVLVQAAIAHAQFVTVHPLPGGN